MNEIDERLADIEGIINADQLAAIKAQSVSPITVICPLNKRYAQLPNDCIGYQYVCKYLGKDEMACKHPQRLRQERA